MTYGPQLYSSTQRICSPLLILKSKIKLNLLNTLAEISAFKTNFEYGYILAAEITSIGGEDKVK